MPVTRPADVPVEMANLLMAMNRCCEGLDSEIVINAAMNMLVMALGYHARECDLTHATATEMTEQVAAAVIREFERNWNRKPQPGDIIVPLQGN
jgi:hypothetical protein